MPFDERSLHSYLSTGNYRNTTRCFQDIRNSLNQYPSLRPVFEDFIFNDGTQKKLVCLQGTIPVPYKGNTYNIPMKIWVLDTHPLHAPMCFVNPTADMQIKVSRNVDYNGKVYLPYLHEWTDNNSDILGLIQICIITFSESPPVFARAPQQVVPPPGPMAYPPPSSMGYNNQPAAYGGVYPPMSQPPQPPIRQENASLSQEDEYTLKASLVSAVEDKVRRFLKEDLSTKQVELESLKKVKEDLQTSQNSIKGTLDSMNRELTRLNEISSTLSRQKGELEEAKSSLKEGEEGNVDDLVQVVYPLYNQLLNAYAEDSAIDDTVYFLGEALRQGVVDCDNFLKNVRNISRKQFFLRATILKCRSKAKLDH